jgi:hypothetical protein
MRAFRFIGVAGIGAALSLGAAACVSTVTGTGTFAASGPTPTGTPTSTDQPTSAPGTDPSTDPSTAPSTETTSPTPTVDPVKTKEQVTCVLVQASVKSTNDKFNAAKTRDQQVSILRSGRLTVKSNLDRSGLPRTDRIYVGGVGIYNELTKLVQGAQKGSSPSTTPYNNATNRFRTACLSL